MTVCSISAIPMPPTMPPMAWLRASRGFTTRPPIRADKPAHAHEPEVAIHGHFREYSAERLHGVLVALVSGLRHRGPLQHLEPMPCQNLPIAFAARRIGAQKQAALSRVNLVRTCSA